MINDDDDDDDDRHIHLCVLCDTTQKKSLHALQTFNVSML